MHIRSLTAIALALGLLAACDKQEDAQPYAVEEVPLSRVADDLAAGATSSVMVTQAYIDRIGLYNGAVNGVIAIMPDALEQAAASDQRRKDGKTLGPLDGIPILIKDNIDALGLPTTAGSFALIDNVPLKDSEVARRLREAGAVILGKANTSQWAGLRTTAGGLNGSTVGGPAHNPYDLARGAAGSSNGSGISAAASFAAATVGTDTTGSVVAPSNANGVVGLRPTVALISRRGIVPVSLTQDTAGPMGRNVRDVAMLLTVLAGTDAADPATAASDTHKTDYANALSIEALQGKRIGVYRGTNAFERTQAQFEEALSVLQAQGATLVDIPDAVLEDLSQEQRLIMIYDIKEDMAAYLAQAPANVKHRTLADLIAFNKADPRENTYGQDLFEAAEATTGRGTPAYIETREYAQRRAGAEGYGKAMSDYEISAIVAPTGGPAGLIGGGAPAPGAAPPAGGGHPAAVTPKGARKPSISGVAALAGYPNLSVPMGYVDGMPVGLSFVGPPWSEDQLLAMGYAYEQASKKRVPPSAYKQGASSN
ncbi:MAG: amidase family protein [Rhodospirillaceae bacterium]